MEPETTSNCPIVSLFAPNKRVPPLRVTIELSTTWFERSHWTVPDVTVRLPEIAFPAVVFSSSTPPGPDTDVNPV